ERVAVGVGRAGIERVGEDAVHDGAGPQAPAAARPPRPGGEALEDLAERHPLVDQPAIEHAHHLGLGGVDDEVRPHAGPLGDVARAVGRLAADPLPGPAFWSLPRRKRSPSSARSYSAIAPWIWSRSWSCGSSEIGWWTKATSHAALRSSSSRSTW